MPNGLTSIIHKKNPPNFLGMLGEDAKNDPRKKLVKKIKQRSRKLKKGFSQVLVKQTVGGLYSLFDGGGWSKMKVSFSVSSP